MLSHRLTQISRHNICVIKTSSIRIRKLQYTTVSWRWKEARWKHKVWPNSPPFPTKISTGCWNKGAKQNVSMFPKKLTRVSLTGSSSSQMTPGKRKMWVVFVQFECTVFRNNHKLGLLQFYWKPQNVKFNVWYSFTWKLNQQILVFNQPVKNQSSLWYGSE